MQIKDDDYKTLKTLEESLWIKKTRFDSKYMDNILSPDFFEFGRSGRIYRREDILAAAPFDIKALLPLQAFSIHPIGEDVILITYISKVEYEKVEVSNRSSIWIKTDRGWQLRFHQGTPTS